MCAFCVGSTGRPKTPTDPHIKATFMWARMMASDDIYYGSEQEWNGYKLLPFSSVPFVHQAALFFPLNHKINKALLKDLFRKIAFKGRDPSPSTSGTIEQVDRSGICCTEIMLSDSLRWWKFQVSIELSMGVDEFLGSILIFSVPRMWFVDSQV